MFFSRLFNSFSFRAVDFVTAYPCGIYKVFKVVDNFVASKLLRNSKKLGCVFLLSDDVDVGKLMAL